MLTGAQCRAAGLDPAGLLAPLADFRTLALAVSGGGDSLALLLLYAAWRKENASAPEAVVYCVDHGLRPEAAQEAEMVMDVAARLGLKARVLHWTGDKPASGVQAAARAARYGLMRAAMEEDGAQALVTAHQREDQAETVLMRLAHGSGLGGLGGIRARDTREGMAVLRPLLAAPRAQLAGLVALAGLVPAHDPSNEDAAYERVRWRAALRDLASLGLTAERLGQFAARAQRMEALADDVLAQFLARHAVAPDAFGVIGIDGAALAGADDEIAIRALRACCAQVSGAPVRGLSRLEALWADDLGPALRAGERCAPTTLAGAAVRLRGGLVLIHREAGRMAPGGLALEPGQWVVFDGRFRLMAQRAGLCVAPAAGMSRARMAAFLGAVPALPMAALAGAPAVVDDAGALVALGTVVPAGGVVVERIAALGR